MEDLRFAVAPEKKAETLRKAYQTSVFLKFIEERPFEEQKLLIAEMQNILENGMPFSEYLLTGFSDAEISWTDYRKIATLCFVEPLMKFTEENQARTRDLHSDANFNETYETAFAEICHFLCGTRPDFPREAVRCLFLLTDEDIDPHRQGLTAARLIIESFPFCDSDEQRDEIERLVKGCKI